MFYCNHYVDKSILINGNEGFMMNDFHDRLTFYLLEKNEFLTSSQARTWVELLWDDFETTYAKAGREYMGSEMTAKVVRQWIDYYGETLHEFAAKNPKYKDYLNQDKKSLN